MLRYLLRCRLIQGRRGPLLKASDKAEETEEVMNQTPKPTPTRSALIKRAINKPRRFSTIRQVQSNNLIVPRDKNRDKHTKGNQRSEQMDSKNIELLEDSYTRAKSQRLARKNHEAHNTAF